MKHCRTRYWFGQLRTLAVLIVWPIDSALADEPVPELSIEQLEPGLFLHRSYKQVEGWGLVGSNGLVVVDDAKALIIDTPWSAADTEQLIDWIEQQDLAVLGSISTHWHEDRTAGIATLNDKTVPTHVYTMTNQRLQQKQLPLASDAFSTPVFTLAEGLAEAYYPGPGHTPDNIVVWLPKSKTLFGGCLVRSVESKGLGYTGDAVVDQWSQSIQNILARYPHSERVVPGHGKVGGSELLNHTFQLSEAANGPDS